MKTPHQEIICSPNNIFKSPIDLFVPLCLQYSTQSAEPIDNEVMRLVSNPGIEELYVETQLRQLYAYLCVQNTPPQERSPF